VNTQKSNKGFEALFNNAAIGIIAVDANGYIVLANQFSLTQFGYEESELLGQKIEILIPTSYKSRHIKHREHYHNANSHNRPMGLGMDLHGVKKDGTEFSVEVSLSPYELDTGKFSIAFISDISIRKQSEFALLQLNAELEQKVEERTHSLSEALEREKELSELKSRFVSMASHEFRTPLSTILSSAYLISKYTITEDQSKRDKHIQRIVSSANMLTDILNDFLSVGKIEEGRMQLRYADCHIPDIITELISEMNTVIKKGQTLDYIHEGGDIFWLDPTLLKHIMMNIVSNAIKFSPEDALIKIKTEVTADRFCLSVKDAGIGISKEDMEHLFERFFRGNNVVNIQGTGLGLHIVSKYVELMNGTVVCKSELGKGTEFIIKFETINKE
jgi:PAS domain S-box-containing protein